jgi:RNA polymerase-binding transcription factor DksA
MIAIERLEEVPVAKYSVKGKEIMERRKRQGL